MALFCDHDIQVDGAIHILVDRQDYDSDKWVLGQALCVDRFREGLMIEHCSVRH